MWPHSFNLFRPVLRLEGQSDAAVRVQRALTVVYLLLVLGVFSTLLGYYTKERRVFEHSFPTPSYSEYTAIEHVHPQCHCSNQEISLADIVTLKAVFSALCSMPMPEDTPGSDIWMRTAWVTVLRMCENSNRTLTEMLRSHSSRIIGSDIMHSRSHLMAEVRTTESVLQSTFRLVTTLSFYHSRMSVILNQVVTFPTLVNHLYTTADGAVHYNHTAMPEPCHVTHATTTPRPKSAYCSEGEWILTLPWKIMGDIAGAQGAEVSDRIREEPFATVEDAVEKGFVIGYERLPAEPDTVFQRYYNTCKPWSCRWTAEEPRSGLEVLVVVVGLVGGLHTLLRQVLQWVSDLLSSHLNQLRQRNTPSSESRLSGSDFQHLPPPRSPPRSSPVKPPSEPPSGLQSDRVHPHPLAHDS